MRWFWRVLLVLAVLGAATIGSIYLIDRHILLTTAAKQQTSVSEIPVEDPKRIAIVFGAKVRPDGSLTNSLYDRVFTAVELYQAGRVKKLLMSGDKSGENYDEPSAMRNLALSLGVPDSDIVIDDEGRKTYDSCYRAKEIYAIQKAVLVTQDYHLPRALYLCTDLGIDSIGIIANRREYDGERYFHFREFFARAKAWLEINFLTPTPATGEKAPIEQQKLS